MAASLVGCCVLEKKLSLDLKNFPYLSFTLFLGGQLPAEAELFSLAHGAATSKAHAMRPWAAQKWSPAVAVYYRVDVSHAVFVVP